jgi:phospholipid/cholesterol/gamma-HCH transport system substrate-binding protein/paraquat-inducible protein B
VLTAIGVLIALILIFGSGQFFKSSFMVETYIKQSVTGLDTGADVRFRGVKIGQVKMIGLSGDIYERNVDFDKRRQYVVVRMQIFGDKVNEEQIAEFVEKNLRARVKSMGITGVSYVEFDFVAKGSETSALEFNWTPAYPVIPSMPNQADEIISGIQKLIGSLNEMKVGEVQKKLDSLLDNLNVMIGGDGKGNEGVIRSVKDLNVILARIAKVTDKEELSLLMRELVGATVALRQTLTSIQGDTTMTIENLKQTSENLNELSRIASQSPASLIWGEPPPKFTPPLNGAQGQSGAQK